MDLDGAAGASLLSEARLSAGVARVAREVRPPPRSPLTLPTHPQLAAPPMPTTQGHIAALAPTLVQLSAA